MGTKKGGFLSLQRFQPPTTSEVHACTANEVPRSRPKAGNKGIRISIHDL